MQVLDLQEVLARVQQQVYGVLHHPGLVQEGAAPRRHRPVRDGYVVHPLHAQQPREDGSKDVSAPHRLQLALQADLLRRGRGRLERRCGRLAVAVAVAGEGLVFLLLLLLLAVRRLLSLALVDELHQRLVREPAHQEVQLVGAHDLQERRSVSLQVGGFLRGPIYKYTRSRSLKVRKAPIAQYQIQQATLPSPASFLSVLDSGAGRCESSCDTVYTSNTLHAVSRKLA